MPPEEKGKEAGIERYTHMVNLLHKVRRQKSENDTPLSSWYKDGLRELDQIEKTGVGDFSRALVAGKLEYADDVVAIVRFISGDIKGEFADQVKFTEEFVNETTKSWGTVKDSGIDLVRGLKKGSLELIKEFIPFLK